MASMPALRDFVARMKATGGTAHLVGLVSPGGVHSHQPLADLELLPRGDRQLPAVAIEAAQRQGLAPLTGL